MGTPAQTVNLENIPQFADIADSGDVRDVALAAHHWLYQTLAGMCQDRSGIWIDTRVDDAGVSFTVTVAASDYGYIVGKEGRNMRALRTIVRCMEKRFKTRIEVILARAGAL